MRRRLTLLSALALSLLPASAVAEDLPHGGGPDAQLQRLSRLQGSASLGRNRQVSGATILVRGVGGAGAVFVTSSDHRGLFSVDGLVDGRYRVELRRDGLETVVKESVDLQFPARPVVEVIMTPRTVAEPPATRLEAATGAAVEVRLSGRVEIRGDGALSSAKLRLRRLDGSLDPVNLRSSEDGSFSMPKIACGAWHLDARVAGFLPVRTPLIIAEDTVLKLSLVAQSAGYKPSPLELMPREQIVPPESLR